MIAGLDSILGAGGGFGGGGRGGGGGGGGGYVSASSSASSGPIGYNPTLGNFGGIQTGGTQGVDVTTIALIAGAVLLAVLLLRQ